MTLDEETEHATELLRGKIVKQVRRQNSGEVVIEFEDGSRFFANGTAPLELSITIGA